jgi:phosphoenolpyruvate synthase/pyruvate phosphate dikinase
MELIRAFKNLSKNDAGLAGGKGASLGEMTQAGIPVPPGFVVLSASFEQFIRETDLIQEIDSILSKVNHKEIHTVESASEKIRELILNAEMPKDIASEIDLSFKELDTKYVAVRSSATAEDGKDHAWAGQLESYLNTTEDDILNKVKLCWSSLFTPRAIFYRFEKGLDTTKISVAVVVQKMVNSELSGIAFSVHPVTENYNQLIIEAGFGLGEAIVSGSVTPDSYVVEKEPRRIIDINISTQNRALYRITSGGNEWKEISEPKASSQVLNEKQILELSEIILNIERHYNFPCDIEWAYEAGKFYIVQSRPITTLSKQSARNVQEKIPLTNWIKYWEAPVKPLYAFTSLQLGELANYLGPETTLHNIFVMYENGLMSAYYYFPDVERFQKGSVAYLEKKDGPSDLKKRAEVLLARIQELQGKSNYHKDDLILLKTLFDEAHVYVGVIKTAGDASIDQKTFDDLLNLRKQTENIFFDLNNILEKIASKSIGKGPLSLDESMLLSYDELLHFLKDNTLPSREEILKRATCALYITPAGFKELKSEEYQPILNEIHKEISNDTLKGQSAFKGIVSGTCVVIRDFSLNSDIPEGSILVTGMTDPRFVPIMKKAAAIVTDAGGMLSHAAIVSRELKIPCVVGTRVATQILKDGDVVEVDANTGVIRILNSDNVSQTPKTLFGIVRNDYEGLGQWVSPVLEFELWMDWSITEDALKLGFPKDPYPWVSVDGHFFKRKDDAYVFIREKVYSEFKNNTYDFTKSILKKAEELSTQCIKSAEGISGLLSFDEFKKYFEMMHRLRFPWMSFFPIDQGSSRYLKEYAESHALNVDDVIASLPQLPNTLTEDQKKLVEFKKKIDSAKLEYDIEKISKANDSLSKDLLAYQRKTEYIGTHHMWGDPRTIDRLLSAISHAHEIGESSAPHREGAKYPFASVLSEMSKWRLECAQSSARLAYALRPTLAAFAEKAGITYDDIIQLTTKEIELLLNDNLKDLSFIKDRQDKFAIFRLENDINVLTGKKYDEIASFFGLNEKLDDIEIIKGSIGNKGKVRGIVAIVRKPQDSKKVEKGMILVAPETTPDFIPAMGMAAAFVTDFGGITSHAAIVAREMNKPCIIGTKIATKVLKDGDTVEVDADNGVVTKI